MADIEDEFRYRLKDLRKKEGLTQAELSARAGLDRTYVGKIERGERTPSLHTIGRLAKALEIEVWELFKF